MDLAVWSISALAAGPASVHSIHLASRAAAIPTKVFRLSTEPWASEDIPMMDVLELFTGVMELWTKLMGTMVESGHVDAHC